MELIDGKKKKRLIARLSHAYEVHRGRMYAAAFAILQDETDAEEAVIKTFERLIKHPEYITDPESEKTGRLLILLAEHQATDRYRKNKKHPMFAYEQLEAVCGEASCIDQIEDAALLQAALARLSQQHREVLLLKFSHGYENDEIAQMLGISEAAVRKRISRAKAQLRPICEEYGLIEKEE